MHTSARKSVSLKPDLWNKSKKNKYLIAKYVSRESVMEKIYFFKRNVIDSNIFYKISHGVFKDMSVFCLRKPVLYP